MVTRVRVYDVTTRAIVAEHDAPNAILSLHWSTDGTYLIAVDHAGLTYKLTVTGPAIKFVERAVKQSRRANRFSTVCRHGSWIAFADNLEQREVFIADLETHKIKDRFVIHDVDSDAASGKSLSIASSRAGQLAVASTRRGHTHVQVYDPGTKREIVAKTISDVGLTRGSLTWSPSSAKLAGGTERGTVVVFDATTCEPLFELVGHRAPPKAIAWAPGGTRIASCAGDGTVRIWDAQNGEQVAAFRLQGKPDLCSVDWSPDGRRLAVGATGGMVFVLDAGQSMPLGLNSSRLGNRGDTATTRVQPDITTLPQSNFLGSTYASAESILVDNFNDGNDDGWTRMDSNVGRPWGPGKHDASSGAYRLMTAGNVPGNAPGRGFLLSFWNRSSAPEFSNGFLRTKVRIDTTDGVGAILFRYSGDLAKGFDGYAFIGIAESGFFINRIESTNVTLAMRVPGVVMHVGEEWWMKGGAVGDEISMKVWRVGEPEPDLPQLTVIGLNIHERDLWSRCKSGIRLYV